MIYIDIGYKSATQQTDEKWKDTKDEEAALNLNFSTLNQVFDISI